MRTIQVPRRFVRQAWGGTETVILETSRRLPGLGHETEILCPNALADADEETVDGVRVRRTGYFYPYLGLSVEAKAQLDRKAGNLVSFSLLRELLTRPGLDLVHLHTGKRLGKTVQAFAKDHDKLVVKGAVFEGDVLTAAAVERLATMPGRDQLRAQFLALLMTPATQFVRVLSAPSRGVVQVLDARRRQQEEGA